MKTVLKSKTFWFNLAMAVVLLFGDLAEKELVSTKLALWVTVVVNFILRFMTNQGLLEADRVKDLIR